jgi:hypothetical protein
LFGLLGVAWTYRLGRDLISPRAGLVAAAVVASSAFYVHYLHELRMYTLFVVLTAFVTWAYLRVMTAPRPRPLLWTGLFAGALAMPYIHYFSMLPLVGIAVYHAWAGVKRRGRRWWGVVGVFAAAALLFVPWAGVLLAGLRLAAESTELHARALDAGETLGALVTLFGNGVPVLALAAFLLAAWGGIAPVERAAYMPSLEWFRWGEKRAWFFAGALLVALLATNAVLQIMHEGRVRYLISLWPLLAVLVGLGVDRLAVFVAGGVNTAPTTAWRVTGAALAVWLVPGVANSLNDGFAASVDGSSYVFPMHTVATALRPQVQPDDVVISYPPDGQPFWVYERNQDIGWFYFRGVPVNLNTMRTMRDPAAQPERLAQTVSAIGERLRVWLAYVPSATPSTMPALEAVLAEHYQQCAVSLDSNTLQIRLYTRRVICCPTDTPRPALVTFGDGIALTGLDPLPEGVGDTLPVVTTWRVGADITPNTYSVALHVTDEAGELVAQADFGLATLAHACHEARIDVAALPPGSYTLHAIVYAWQTGERLPATDAQTGATGDRIPIGTFTK